jgi:flagellin FlaB
MRKLIKILFRKDHGAIGIGAMIVLIAMILVAGIAASVIIQTSNTIQLQALQTGQKTTKEVSSGISVFEITGLVYNSSGSSTLENITKLAITIKPRPGSDDIDLNNTYILISDGVKKSLLRYGYQNRTEIFDSSVSGDLFESISDANWNITDYETFGIGVLQDEDNSMTAGNPVINRGDKAVLFLRCNSTDNGLFGRQIPTRTEIFGQVIPEIGSPGVISFTTPMTYVDLIYKLQ